MSVRVFVRGVAVVAVTAFSAGCAAELSDDEGVGPEGYTVESVTTCSARLERYPVNGPHNGGWDRNATTFRCPPHSLNNTDYYTGRGDANHQNGHLGNDIFGRRGTPIVAARSGIVDDIANTSIGGRNVTIRDDCGWYYYYAHMDSVSGNIAVGRRVSAGTQIGTLGDTGSARGTEPHLHFSVFPGSYNRGIDPFPLLSAVQNTACREDAPTPTPPPSMMSGSCPARTDFWYCPANENTRQLRCRNGRWEERRCPGGCVRRPVGEDDQCIAAPTTCHSDTLGRAVNVGTCLQSRFDELWYQCTVNGWLSNASIPSTRRGAAGPCTSYYPRR